MKYRLSQALGRDAKDMRFETSGSLSVGIFYRDLLRPGGIPRETMMLAKEMEKLVDRLVLYCYMSESSRKKITHIDDIPVKTFYQPGWRRNRDPLWAATGIKDIFRTNEDEISVLMMIGSFIPENAPVAQAAREGNIPYVLSIGDGFNPFLFSGLKGFKKHLYEHAFERHLLDGALAIRLYSGAQVSHLTSRGYVDDGRFFIAKEGVDWESVEMEGGGVAAISSEVPLDPITFGFLGRLSVYQKGLDILLEAWSLYKKNGGRGRLRIAGPATRRDSARLDRLRRRSELPAVHFLPAVYGNEKYKFLRSLSYLVHPSRHEGIPRVIREAFAVGCPVVVTENTNLHDVVNDHRAGAVVRTDPRDLAQTLTALDQAHRDWPALREGARSAARSLNWEDIARNVTGAMSRGLAARGRTIRA